MNVISVQNASQMSWKAANIIAAQVLQKPNAVIGLATGSTPLETYQNLIQMHQSNGLDFSSVRSFNLDEYVGISTDNEQSYYRFMMNHLFDHLNFDESNIHIPNGNASDLEAECAQYDEKMDQAGGIDLQLLGIGNNGHIGFNEPGDSFILPTHYVEIAQNTIEANARFFASIDEVPKAAITMGIGAIMQARNVLLIAGQGKQNIVEKAFYGSVTPQIPASILQLHPNVTVIYVQ